MTTKDVLTQARALIEKGWTQDALARDAEGQDVYPKNSDACQWCATGAIWAVVGISQAYLDAFDMIDNLVRDNYEDIGYFNDAPDTTQADVIKLFDEAIARCESGKEKAEN